MHYIDLTPYTYLKSTSEPLIDTAPQSLNVGWLDKSHGYSRGSATYEFMARLWQIGLAPVNLTRGWHDCDFCDDPSLAYLNVRQGDEELGMGNAEIWVFAEDKVYIAPTLIYHYITHHGYLPPEPFITAVMHAPLPGTPEYDRLASQFMWGKHMLRRRAIEQRYAERKE